MLGCLSKEETAVAVTAQAPLQRSRKSRPLIVRLTHWVNAVAMVLMIGSGWHIFNDSPLAIPADTGKTAATTGSAASDGPLPQPEATANLFKALLRGTTALRRRTQAVFWPSPIVGHFHALMATECYAGGQPDDIPVKHFIGHGLWRRSAVT